MLEYTYDGIAFFIAGLFIGLVVAFSIGSNVRNTAITDACGTCEEKGKICGEFVCTRDGWE